ncbi:Vacuolar assembly/sorting proteins VPS39/VAM6/VPS3 [Phaffia rhodozyma]|uniref:Vacuolar assembly/sorting proteins VPS39/VAM6/VPS3 n=1 Tax=Phaffia rhodozyma TaxID=264483 RepID=A0A0F7ST53_PHARH|nr:Vacuolar assembly/sorting proteins VPS39/VAM6/VPS3 [Phaffia rhodozyma]
MDPESPPSNLYLTPLLPDLEPWLSSPEQTSRPNPPASNLLHPASSAAAFLSNARAGNSIFNLLPGGKVTPPLSSSPKNGPSQSEPSGSIDGDRVKKVKCKWVEGYNNNLYIGTSDGQVLWYTYSTTETSIDPYTLRHKHSIFPRRPIDRIYLLPSISKALILSESTLHFVTLPSLEPVLPALIQPIRGVVAVSVDEGHEYYSADGVDEVGLCVVKRKVISVLRLGTRLFHVKEIPIPEPAVLTRYYSPTLCQADSTNYSLVSINESTSLPILPLCQASAEGLAFKPKPNIAIVQEDEFLMTSLINSNNLGATIGLFVNGNGDPVRGAIEWDGSPRSLVVNPPYVISLLRNRTIQVHSLISLELIQTIPLPPNMDARVLTKSPQGFNVPSTERDTLLRKMPIPLLQSGPPSNLTKASSNKSSSDAGANDDVEEDDKETDSNVFPTEINHFDPPSGSGLTPPSSPPAQPAGRSSFQHSTRSSVSSYYNPGLSSTPQLSNVFVLSSTSIYALTPTPPLLAALDTLTSSAIVGSGDIRKSGGGLTEALTPLLMDASFREGGQQDIEAVQFIHHKVFLKGLREARFGRVGESDAKIKEDPTGDAEADDDQSQPENRPKVDVAKDGEGEGEQAEMWLFGGGDVRLIIRLFADLRRVLERENIGDVWVEDGLVEEWEKLWDIEEIIQTHLKRIYDPHIHPNVASSPSTLELHKILLNQARHMLRLILEREREGRSRRHTGRKQMGVRDEERNGEDDALNRIVDTSLLILLSRIGSTSSILDILDRPHSASMDLVRSSLEMHSRWFALGRCSPTSVESSLEMFAALVEGTKVDEDCPRDPMNEILSLLAQSEDIPLVRKWGLWVVARDPERGLSLFIHSGLNFDHSDLVDELRQLQPEAGDKYLQHVVINRNSLDKNLHTSLASRYLERTRQELENGQTKKFFDNALIEYHKLSDSKISLIQHLASFLPESPAKQLKFKTILFLQNSELYDLETVRDVLDGFEGYWLEKAIVYGKLRMHDAALDILARVLRDTLTAEIYCIQGEKVIPCSVGLNLARRFHLDEWMDLSSHDIGSIGASEENRKRELLMALVKIYMSDGNDSESTALKTAHLLNDQAMNLDIVDILELIPEPWELQPITSFLTRSIRRTLHDQAEGQILRALATSLNFQTMDKALEAFASYPPIVETSLDSPSSGDGGDVDEKGEKRGSAYEEGATIAEKIVGHALDERDATVREKEKRVEVDRRKRYVDVEEVEEGLA